MLALLFFSFFSHAQIVCTHPQVCNLAQEILVTQSKMKNVLPMNVDPHHFEPGIGQVKESLSAKILITAPIELQPWLKNILETRKKKNLPTFVLKTLGQTDTLNAQAHFWMYPEVVCFNWMNLRMFLADQKLAVKSDDCVSPAKPSHSVDRIFILSHDALKPLLSKYAGQVIALKTSDHHAEILPSTLKLLTTLPDSEKVVWVMEKNIIIPDQIIKSYRKPHQSFLTFDLDGIIGERPHGRFLDLMKKIGL
ncbi:MAG: metal ABC transporter solute-binding protein, Zn/Mn family [Bacteriovoracaceae bacterium]